MGRSGYVESDGFGDYDTWDYIRQCGARKSALRGKRGQAFLRRLAAALEAMPVKSLCAIPSAEDGHWEGCWGEPGRRFVEAPGADRLGLPTGEVCALGSLARLNGIDPSAIDATDHKGLAKMFDVAPTVIRDIEWENDEACGSGEERWKRLREWVQENLIEPAAADAGKGAS